MCACISEPGGHEFDHIRFSAYFAISGLFFLLQQKSTQDHPQRIVAFPFIDVWLLFHIHLLFRTLDFKENKKKPIMQILSCSVKCTECLRH